MFVYNSSYRCRKCLQVSLLCVIVLTVKSVLLSFFFSSLLNNASVREVLKWTLNIYAAQGEIPRSS